MRTNTNRPEELKLEEELAIAINAGEQRFPRIAQTPPLITIEVRRVVVNCNGFLHFSPKEIVLFRENLRFLKTNVVLGDEGVFYQGQFEDSLMIDVSTVFFKSSLERMASFTYVRNTTRGSQFVHS